MSDDETAMQYDMGGSWAVVTPGSDDYVVHRDCGCPSPFDGSVPAGVRRYHENHCPLDGVKEIEQTEEH